MAYTPGFSAKPEKLDDLWTYLQDELASIGAELSLGTMRNVEFLAVAPKKPREGMIRGADGVNWNPGSGKGVYAYYSSAWHLLG